MKRETHEQLLNVEIRSRLRNLFNLNELLWYRWRDKLELLESKRRLTRFMDWTINAKIIAVKQAIARTANKHEQLTKLYEHYSTKRG